MKTVNPRTNREHTNEKYNIYDIIKFHLSLIKSLSLLASLNQGGNGKHVVGNKAKGSHFSPDINDSISSWELRYWINRACSTTKESFINGRILLIYKGINCATDFTTSTIVIFPSKEQS